VFHIDARRLVIANPENAARCHSILQKHMDFIIREKENCLIAAESIAESGGITHEKFSKILSRIAFSLKKFTFDLDMVEIVVKAMLDNLPVVTASIITAEIDDYNNYILRIERIVGTLEQMSSEMDEIASLMQDNYIVQRNAGMAKEHYAGMIYTLKPLIQYKNYFSGVGQGIQQVIQEANQKLLGSGLNGVYLLPKAEILESVPRVLGQFNLAVVEPQEFEGAVAQTTSKAFYHFRLEYFDDDVYALPHHLNVHVSEVMGDNMKVKVYIA
jgi:hypothetical protein